MTSPHCLLECEATPAKLSGNHPSPESPAGPYASQNKEVIMAEADSSRRPSESFVQQVLATHRSGMTRRQFIESAAGTAALAALGLSGCGSSETSDEDGRKVLNFAQTNAKKGLDEHVINDQLSYSLADCVAESPLMWTEDLELVPCLLKEIPTVSADGLTYSLTLKDNIACHD
jgi:hypothetical protein